MSATIKGFTTYKFESVEAAKEAVKLLTEETLQSREFQECGKFDQLKVGFSPFSDGSFTLNTPTAFGVQITTQSKKVHSAELKRKCKVKEEQYKIDSELEELDKETKDEIKRLITEEMLPTTPAGKEDTIIVWVNKETLIVGVGTYSKAEDALDFLRMVIGSLPVTPTEVVLDVGTQLTKMVDNGYYETIVLGDKVEMLGEDGKSIITFAKESVYNVETKIHLKAGATVKKLQLEYDGIIEFTLNDKFEASALKLDKEVLCGSKDEAAVMVTIYEVNKLIKELEDVFGGVKTAVADSTGLQSN